jgi:hypothetical protein
LRDGVGVFEIVLTITVKQRRRKKWHIKEQKHMFKYRQVTKFLIL